MGHEAGPYEPGSPFAINFRTDVKEGTSVVPINSSVSACFDPSLACSCGDCPAASTCAEPNPPAPPQNRGCFVRIVGLEVLFEGFASCVICTLDHATLIRCDGNFCLLKRLPVKMCRIDRTYHSVVRHCSTGCTCSFRSLSNFNLCFSVWHCCRLILDCYPYRLGV